MQLVMHNAVSQLPLSTGAVENVVAQEEELVGLEAIFGNDVRIEREHPLNCEVPDFQPAVTSP